MGCLVVTGHAHLVRAVQTVEADGGPTELVHDIDHALCHLDRVILVLEPERFRARLEDCDDPEDRVRVAALTEHVELMLEEFRGLVRQQGAH